MPTTNFSAPTLLRGAATIGIDELRALVGFNRVPPDHNGTVGPDHVVSVFNHAMQIFDKAGNLLATQLLDGVFGAAPGGPLPTDPNIMYDAAAGRFVFVSFEVTGFDATINPGNDSVLLNVGVSKTSNPLDGWHVTQIDARTIFNGVNGWSDFPSIAVDGQAIYITANMFGFDGASPFLGNRLWIVAKGDGSGGFYDGGAASFSVHDPVGEAQDLTGRGVVNDTLIAVRIEGVTAADSGIFLVSGDSFTGGANEISQIFRIDNPLAATSITVQSIDLGNIAVEGALPLASQLGTLNRLGSGDDRVWSGGAVERDGRLYYAFDISPISGPDAGQTTVHFVELDATNPFAVALVHQTNIGGEDIGPGVHTFMPSIAVNRDGTVIVNYSASGPSIFPGAYYSIRGSSDSPGVFGPAQTLASGVDYYFRNRAGEGISLQTTNRWGDFSGVSVDPDDGTTFWLFNMFADTRGSPNSAGQDGRWRLTVGEARATILDFEHVAGDPVRDYFGGLGRDGIAFRADAAGGAFSLAANGAGVDFLASGLRMASAFSVENILLAGGAGPDVLTVTGVFAAGMVINVSGGAGDDTLFGNDGADILEGGAGADSMNGGAGFDIASYAGSGSAVRVALWDPALNTGDAAGDIIQFTTEAIFGTAFSDNLQGNSSANNLRGASGNDLILGGFGNDTLVGGAGADDMGGGAGFDVVSYAGGGAVRVAMWNPAFNTGDAAGDNIRADIEVVEGSFFNDSLEGNAAANNLRGSFGHDRISGGGGNDTLSGDFGNDTLDGGAGNDLLIGGGANDTFIYSANGGADVIADFLSGSSIIDVIRLTGLGAAFDTFTEVINAATQQGADTVITFGAGQALTLQNVLLSDLDSDDFAFG